ncbi:hypothetical protein Tco_1484488, partial [Tanacetum coccineum]
TGCYEEVSLTTSRCQMPGAGEGVAAATAEDDDEVPELVPGETFEAAAEEGIKA